MNNENVDIFRRNKSGSQVIDLETFHPLIIEVGNNADSTKIMTPNGEELQGVIKMSINIDAEGFIHTATLTFLNPKIVTK